MQCLFPITYGLGLVRVLLRLKHLRKGLLPTCGNFFHYSIDGWCDAVIGHVTDRVWCSDVTTLRNCIMRCLFDNVGFSGTLVEPALLHLMVALRWRRVYGGICEVRLYFRGTKVSGPPRPPARARGRGPFCYSTSL